MDSINLSDALIAARSLLGCKLLHQTPQGSIGGIIVETEAYMMSDPASHTYRGMTKRTEPMFATAGTVYVYFTYGMHYCMNITTGEIGDGQAVLIRALEPTDGLELMAERRKITDVRKLTSGPARLTQALGVNLSHNGQMVNDSTLHLQRVTNPVEITERPRIGIRQAVEQPWRFYVSGNQYVSRQ